MNNDMIQRGHHREPSEQLGEDSVITTEVTRLRPLKVYAIPFLNASKG